MTRQKRGRRPPRRPPPPPSRPARQPLPGTGCDNAPDGVAHHEAGHAVLDALLRPDLLADGYLVAVGPAEAGRDGVPLLVAQRGQQLTGYIKHQPLVLADLTPQQKHTTAVVAQAGCAAEVTRRAERYPAEPEYRQDRWQANMWQGAWQSEYELSARILGDGQPVPVDRVQQAAWAAGLMVQGMWPAVRAVAEALQTQGQLTGTQVLDLARAAMGDQWPDDATVTQWLAAEPTDDAPTIIPRG